jgi:hypothetical protein
MACLRLKNNSFFNYSKNQFMLYKTDIKSLILCNDKDNMSAANLR